MQEDGMRNMISLFSVWDEYQRTCAGHSGLTVLLRTGEKRVPAKPHMRTTCAPAHVQHNNTQHGCSYINLFFLKDSYIFFVRFLDSRIAGLRTCCFDCSQIPTFVDSLIILGLQHFSQINGFPLTVVHRIRITWIVTSRDFLSFSWIS